MEGQAMARKRMYKMNIDKLKICYRQPEGLFAEYAEFVQQQTICKNDYEFLITENDDQHITMNVICGGIELGTLVLNNTQRYEGFCFFKFANKSLYECLTIDPSNWQRYNFIGVWEQISHDMGLIYNNITELEVCLDFNFNTTAQLRKLVKNYKEYDMFVNGRKVADPDRTIKNYHETFSRSRKKLEKVPTIYIEQKKTDAPLLRAYDKRAEIEADKYKKDYVIGWNDFSVKAPMHRIEVRLKSNSIKEFLSTYPNIDYDFPLHMIQQSDFLFAIWQFFCNRLVFFRTKDGKDITMADLAR